MQLSGPWHEEVGNSLSEDHTVFTALFQPPHEQTASEEHFQQ